MRRINKKATAVLEKMREMMSQNGEGDHLKISNSESYMPVVMERIMKVRAGRFAGSELLSLAHYGQQNGDAMRDPEVVFLRDPHGNYYPDSFRNDYVGVHQNAIRWDDFGEPIHFIPSLQKDIAVFTGQWMQNIKEQQGI